MVTSTRRTRPASVKSELATIRQNALAHERRMLVATVALLESWGDDARLYMRANAAWTDRTGHARFGTAVAGIYPTTALPAGEGLAWVPIHPRDLQAGGRIALITDAEYGNYLEGIRKDGTPMVIQRGLEIIMPTVAVMGPELTQRLKEIWR